MQGAQAEAELQLALTLPRGQMLLADAMQWNISASGALASDPQSAPFPFALSAKGHLSDNRIVDIAALDLASGPATLAVSGAVPLSDPFAAQVNAQLDLTDIAKLVPALAGKANLKLVSETTAKGQTRLSASGSASMALAEGQPIDVALTGGGLLGRDGAGRLTIDLAAGPLSHIDPNTNGTLRLKAVAEDPLLAPRMILQLAAPGLTYAGVQADRAVMRLETLRPVADWNAVQAAASIEVVSGAAQARLATNLDWDGTELAMQGLSIQM